MQRGGEGQKNSRARGGAAWGGEREGENQQILVFQLWGSGASPYWMAWTAW